MKARTGTESRTPLCTAAASQQPEGENNPCPSTEKWVTKRGRATGRNIIQPQQVTKCDTCYDVEAPDLANAVRSERNQT